jgi:hypothetical protein
MKIRLLILLLVAPLAHAGPGTSFREFCVQYSVKNFFERSKNSTELSIKKLSPSEKQKLIEESWKNKRKNELTRMDRGIFRTLKERTLSSSIKVKTFLTTQSLQKEEVASSLLFYPSGETEQALIVIEDSGGEMMSLEIDSLSGRVKTLRGEVTLDQWKKELGIK